MTETLFHGRYRATRLINTREGVATHEAVDLETQARCVVKVLSLKGAAAAQQWELFEREVKVLSHLRHPRIPACLDSFSLEDGGDVRFCLVQALVDGKDLRTLIRDGKRFTAMEVARMLLSATQVLEYIHTLLPPIIHRDIKPANLMLDTQQAIHLIDFGAVKAVLPDQKSGNTVVGTYGYMPLEQFEGRATAVSDIYALGMTAVVLLTGKEPHERDERLPRATSDELSTVPPMLRRIVEKMTQAEPARRHRSAAELRAELQRFVDGRGRRASPWMAVAGVLILGTGGVASYQALQPPPRQPQVRVVDPPHIPPSPPSRPAPPSIPSPPTGQRLLPQTVHAGYACVNRTLVRTRDSHARYLSWVDATRGPTCQERHVYGLYSCYEDSIARCQHAAQLDADFQDLALVNAQLVVLLEKANRYYSDDDYLDDGCQRAREMHPTLMDLFGRAMTANENARRLLAAQLKAAVAKAKGPPGDVGITAAGLAVMTAGLDWMEQLRDGAPQPSLQAAAATWQDTLVPLEAAAREAEEDLKNNPPPTVDQARVPLDAAEMQRYLQDIQAQVRAHAARTTAVAHWRKLAVVTDGFLRTVKTTQRDANGLTRGRAGLMDRFHDRVIDAFLDVDHGW